MNAAVSGALFLVRSPRLFLLTVACVAVVSASGCALLPRAHSPGPAGPAAVAGQITSDRGAILADVAVTLSGPAVYRSARTDIAGRFTFDRVPLGRYVLSASAAGFRKVKEVVTVEKEGAVRVDLKLKM